MPPSLPQGRTPKSRKPSSGRKRTAKYSSETETEVEIDPDDASAMDSDDSSANVRRRRPVPKHSPKRQAAESAIKPEPMDDEPQGGAANLLPRFSGASGRLSGRRGSITERILCGVEDGGGVDGDDVAHIFEAEDDDADGMRELSPFAGVSGLSGASLLFNGTPLGGLTPVGDLTPVRERSPEDAPPQHYGAEVRASVCFCLQRSVDDWPATLCCP